MRKSALKVVVRSGAGRDFQDALARLEKSAPRHAKLKQLASRGALRITVSSVALEAGRSRTLIGTADCPYPHIRTRILELQRPPAQRVTQDEIISDLRRENESLRAERGRLATQLADAIAAAWRLKKEVDFLRSIKSPPDGAKGKVVPLVKHPR